MIVRFLVLQGDSGGKAFGLVVLFIFSVKMWWLQPHHDIFTNN